MRQTPDDSRPRSTVLAELMTEENDVVIRRRNGVIYEKATSVNKSDEECSVCEVWLRERRTREGGCNKTQGRKME